MPEAGKYNDHYSLEAIEAYLTGKLSPAEMHAMEKAALQDPFLADAIEGFRETDMAAARRHLGALDQEILAVAPLPALVPNRQNNFWRVAAAVLLIAGAGTVAVLVNNRSNIKPELAKTSVVPLNDAQETASTKKDSTVIATAPVNDNTFNAKHKPAPQLKTGEQEKATAALNAEGMAAKNKAAMEAVALADRMHAASLSQQGNLSKTAAPSAVINDTLAQQSIAPDQRTYAAARRPTGGKLQDLRSFDNNAAARKVADAPAAAPPPPPYAGDSILPANGWDSLYHFLNQKLASTIKQVDLPDATVMLHLDEKGTVLGADIIAGWPPAAAAALAAALRSGPHWLAYGQAGISSEKKILIRTARIQQWPLK